ncbi:MAG: nuclease-related domain-containing protein [Collinsella sp.]
MAVLAEVQGLANHARELASARYYMGNGTERRECTCAGDAPGRDGFDRNSLEAAYYDNEGVFHVKTRLKTKVLRGVFGEYVVFERLAAALERGDLPFGRVLRALYIPDFGSCERDPYGANFTEEVDMLLVASRALYVIEVKNLRGLSPCGGRSSSTATRSR